MFTRFIFRNRSSGVSVERDYTNRAELQEALRNDGKRLQLIEYNRLYLERGITHYANMSDPAKTKFENLYFLARYPFLLKTSDSDENIDAALLPSDLFDLQALVYFIFRDNLCNCWSNGTNHEIIPFLPFIWSQEEGLRVSEAWRATFFVGLLENLTSISSSKSLYFSVLMVSMELAVSPDETEQNYRLLIWLLTAILEGAYDQSCLSSIKTQSASLKDAWLLNFLPTPPLTIDLSLSQEAQTLKTTLLGHGLVCGIFKPYREPTVTALPVIIAESEPLLTTTHRCCVIS